MHVLGGAPRAGHPPASAALRAGSPAAPVPALPCGEGRSKVALPLRPWIPCCNKYQTISKEKGDPSGGLYDRATALAVGSKIMFGFLKKKAAKHIADEREVRRMLDAGLTGRLPSWVGNSNERDIFLTVIMKMAERKGIPRSYLREILETRNFIDLYLGLTGEMEVRGHSFIEQQLSVVNLLVEYYYVLLPVRDIVRHSMIQLDALKTK
jgi:hypothetical protein